jgi:integrase
MSRQGALSRTCPTCKWSSTTPGLKACGRCGARGLKWRFELDIAPPGSPRKRISRTFDSKDEATESLRDHLDRLGRGGFTQGNGSMTLLEWMHSWVEREERRVKAGTLKIRSWESYVNHVRRYVEGSALGATRLDRLTRDGLEAFYDGLSDRGLKSSTVHRVHATIRRSLADAVERNVLATNPATGAHKAPTSKATIRPWDQAEVGAFLSNEIVTASPHRTALHLAAMSGVRRGELLALRWSDLDMETGRLSIQRAVVRSNTQGLVVGPPKTEAGRRTIVLDSQTVQVLRMHRQRQRIERQWISRDGRLDDDGLMFPNEHGGLLDPDSFSAAFRRLVKRAGLRSVRLHDLRHSHASHLIAIGKSPIFIQHRLGHSKIEVTLGIYGHLFSAMEADDVEDAAEMIYKAAGGSQ